VDVFLYDLKIIDDAIHRKYTGVSNCIILENLQGLSRRGKSVFIRFPVIPNITDTQQKLSLTCFVFPADVKNIQQINLLPYHRESAAGKYEKLRKGEQMVGVMPPSEEELKALQQSLCNMASGSNRRIRVVGGENE